MTARLARLSQVKALLDARLAEVSGSGFIPDDPICIPHRYSHKPDIEIAGLFAATLAWGQRKTIIAKANELMALMSDAPHDYILNHTDHDLKPLTRFVHRTFQATDLLYFVHFLKAYYTRHDSLEDAFAQLLTPEDAHTGPALAWFHGLFFSLPEAPQRTRKHVGSPDRGSSCKRLNMYLRWMVRSQAEGIDFGLWKRISPAQLICPLDVHVGKVARMLGLLERRQNDWQAALELTARLREMDADDPVKYDLALFTIGIQARTFG